MPHILIIARGEGVRRLMQEVAGRLGWTSDAVQDEVRGFAAVLDMRPDLLIFDVGIWKMGMVLVGVIRSRPNLMHLPIILMSGGDTTEAQALQAGANAFLPKPFLPDVACEILGKLLPG